MRNGYKSYCLTVLQDTKCINLLRDESKWRLDLRLQACGDDLVAHKFFMGRAIDYDSTAHGINQACIGLLRKFCTLFQCPPPGANMQEQFLEAVHKKLCNQIEAVTVDSASNEVVAFKDCHLENWTQFPNLKHLVRDVCHGFRRILSRPWAADPILDGTVGMFVTWPSSPCSIDATQRRLGPNLWFMCGAVHRPGNDPRLEDSGRSTSSIREPDVAIDENLSKSFGTDCVLSQGLVNPKGNCPWSGLHCFSEVHYRGVFILLAMLTDASLSAMHLIRLYDRSTVPVTNLS